MVKPKNLLEKKPNPPEKNKVGRRFFLIFLASGVLIVVLHRWIDPDPGKDEPPEPPYLGAGYPIDISNNL